MFLWFACSAIGFFVGSEEDHVIYALIGVVAVVFFPWALLAFYALVGSLYRIINHEEFSFGWLALSFFSGMTISFTAREESSFLISFPLSCSAAVAYRSLCRLAERQGAA